MVMIVLTLKVWEGEREEERGVREGWGGGEGDYNTAFKGGVEL